MCNGSHQTFNAFKPVPYISMECDGALVEKIENYSLFDNGQCFDFACLRESAINIYAARFTPKGNAKCYSTTTSILIDYKKKWQNKNDALSKDNDERIN